jgi:hypothetical protein
MPEWSCDIYHSAPTNKTVLASDIRRCLRRQKDASSTDPVGPCSHSNVCDRASETEPFVRHSRNAVEAFFT